MQVTVYADMLFMVNWLMDYVLLRALAAVLQLSVSKKRTMAAAAIGAVWVCLITMISLPNAVEKVFSLVFISSLMIITAFRPKGVRIFFRALAVLYGIAILGGGLVNLVYFHTGAGYYLKTLVWGQAEQNTKSAAAVLVSAAAVWMTVWLARQLMQYRHRQSGLYTAVLFLGEKAVSLKGLLDTGNQLREPVTGKAVHIAHKEALSLLRLDREDIFKFLVPYHAVGTESGMLTAVRIDRMELTSQDGHCITIERPLIGLYEGRLSTENEYQLILHTEIETRQGETL